MSAPTPGPWEIGAYGPDRLEIVGPGCSVAVLDRRVFHLALHPYYNQLWGMLTLPFTILAAYLYALEFTTAR